MLPRLTNLQDSVFRLARRRIKNRPWYRGVCTDLMPSDDKIKMIGRRRASDILIADTIYYDQR